MPTGYTYPIHESDEFDFTDFALRCSRAFGPTRSQYGDSLDSQLVLTSDEDVKRKEQELESEIQKIKNNIEAIKETSEEEVSLIVEKENDVIQLENDSKKKEYKNSKKRLIAMLKEAVAWVPPTGEHQYLKDFMIEQVESDLMDLSFSPTSYISEKTWASNKIESLQWDLERAEKKQTEKAEEFDREWLTKLIQSLPDGEKRVGLKTSS